MSKKARSRGFYGGILVLFLGATTLWLAALAHGPDRDITFTREVYSETDVRILGTAIHHLSNWTRWHHMAADAKSVDVRGIEYPPKDQFIQPGSLVLLGIEPKKLKHRRFELLLEVITYDRDREIQVRVLKDSGGKLTALFESIQWKIELIPGAKTLLRGTIQAKTRNWRSRLFGTIAQRILMNQIFYVDLIAFAELKDALPVSPHGQAQQ